MRESRFVEDLDNIVLDVLKSFAPAYPMPALIACRWTEECWRWSARVFRPDKIG
ncbi:hypothetical protein L227DRAFT_580918 [Lentinus tigrinus ALCF2SS1-6]|uniref:Uncharacterized protein n=1 Tax=Lentinus tigrinus ALCF2SS1-6 TaxID=1328759 RepID=A0A5C2RTX4_9APHY|nr:hypothetical protein L227DRAFT_580918 [Lentinus tigrinus ALCF2SS1-6]